MEKLHLNQLANLKIYNHLIPGLFMSTCIWRENFPIIKILNRLFFFIGLDKCLHPNTPILQYSSQSYRQCYLSFTRPQNVDFLYNCYGDLHAPI